MKSHLFQIRTAPKSPLLSPKTRSALNSTFLCRSIAILGLMVLPFGAATQAAPSGAPSWVGPTEIESDDGYAELRWETAGSEPVDLFKIQEKAQGSPWEYFVTGLSQLFYRVEPEDYEFKIAACQKHAVGDIKCGPWSSKLILTVTEEIFGGEVAEEENESPKDIADSEVSAATSLDVFGGPDQMQPGMWWNPAKPGHGWSFYWANQLALPSMPSNQYDLYAHFFTYEAKTTDCIDLPPREPCNPNIMSRDYRPVVLEAKLVLDNGIYKGQFEIHQSDGSTSGAGQIELTFRGNNKLADIKWTGNFRFQSFTDIEETIELLFDDGYEVSAPSDLSGHWTQASGGFQPYIVENIGHDLDNPPYHGVEVVEVVFLDDGADNPGDYFDVLGRPTWIQAESFPSMVSEAETPLCFFHIPSGYRPSSSGSMPYFEDGHCESGVINAEREFTGYETEQFGFWVDYSFPGHQGSGFNSPMYVPGGSVSIGTSESLQVFQKSSNFHRVWFNGASSCELSGTPQSCDVDLTWFTDGDFPRATSYAYNQTTGTRTELETSTAPAMENRPFTLNEAGTYVFELRMNNSPSSRLIAKSSPFTVTGSSGGPPANPTGLQGQWISCPNHNYTISWSHGSVGSVSHYHLEESRPGLSKETHTVTPGTNTSKSFTKSSGPFGTYSYRVRACNSSGLCSGYTTSLDWDVPETCPTTDPEHPWGDNAHLFGAPSLNWPWNYALGYHFRPLVDGQVVELGGLFNGSKRVKLFDRATQALLADVLVTSANQFPGSYVTLPQPVSVVADRQYTVAMYAVGSGASYQSISSYGHFEITFGSVEILGGTSIRTDSDPDAIPVNTNIYAIYGQPDIGFVPAGPALQPPEIFPIPDRTDAEGTSPSYQVVATDPDGTVDLYEATNLPPGMGINSTTGLITGTIAAGASASSPYSVTITVTDDDNLTDQESFIWTVTPGSGGATPETPPNPVPMPNMTPDTTSSQVGATAGTFRVDESGAAIYSIPILTAPGSGGMAPQISLDYSSQVGNSIAGLGWSIGGLSAITRCGQTLAQDGPDADRGITLTSNDRFCLDGERLMLVSGNYGANGAEYRLERDPIAKIVSYGTAGNGPAYFKVWRKDGSITEYGNTTNSRIEARTATDTSTALIWAQNRISDSASNHIDFAYQEFTGSAGDPIEYVLSAINYTGNTTAGKSPYAQLLFTYSGNRSDATRRSVAGSTIEQTRLLTRIDSKARKSAGALMESLRSYILSYDNDSYGRRILQTVTECRDSTQSVCFSPAQFGWHKSLHQVNDNASSIQNVFDPANYEALALADINGDGRPDLLVSERASTDFRFKIALALPTGGFANPGAQTYAIPAIPLKDIPIQLYAIDLNADGYQDVIYPTDAAWKGRLSNGASLDSEIIVADNCCGLFAPEFVRIMDVDGDGLADLITSKSGGTTGQFLVSLRNLYSPANPGTVGFETFKTVRVNLGNLFPDNIDNDNYCLTSQPVQMRGWDAYLSNRHAQPFDYNGDGAVDLLVQFSAFYSDGGCPPDGPEGSFDEFEFGDSGTDQDGASGSIYEAQFVVVLVSTESELINYDFEFNLQNVVGIGSECNFVHLSICNPDPGQPTVKDFMATDMNADGLGDFAFREIDGDWYVQTNQGGTFSSTWISLGNQSNDQIADFSRFLDLNGDGYPEFLSPRAASGDTYWDVRYNQHGMLFAPTASQTNIRFGNAAQEDISVLVDFTGDGMVDNLFVDRDNAGQVIELSTKLYEGFNSVPFEEHAATLIDYISTGVPTASGKYNETFIDYRPLTDPSVYTGMSDSSHAQWASGHAVYDLIAPTFVVGEVSSSAPLFGFPTATSSIEYHYVGAKIQGGGRGFLGFGEVITYDPQSGIRTNTRYRQDFPFTGLPADTTRVLVTNTNFKLAPISDPTSVEPESWPAVTETTPPVSGVNGTLIGYAINEWAATETVAGKGSWFAYIANSLERSYTLAGNFDRKVRTNNVYNGVYGNLDSAAVVTYATDDSPFYAAQITTNTYNDNTTDWHLGRLVASAVNHVRAGVGFMFRDSRFGYDPTTGILTSETVEPGTAFEVTTSYELDNFGNRRETTVTGAGGMLPRVTTTNYDALGRFVVETINAENQLTRKVTSWDAFGNPLTVQNIDGIVTTTAADLMGRPFITYIPTGEWSKSLHAPGHGTVCPSNITSFHTHTLGGGAPDQYQCFDILGREIRSVTQGFDATQLIRVDTFYDDSGRVQLVSEPYFASGSPRWNVTQYDAVGRVTSVSEANGNVVTNAWDEEATGSCPGYSAGARALRITNGLMQNRFEVRNALGEVIEVLDDDCGKITYQYDSVGNLLYLTGVDGAVVEMQYDQVGRKVLLDDPDAGVRQYKYNALGELTRQLDSKQQAIDFQYDKLGRVTHRRELTGVSSLSDTSYTVAHHEITTYKTTSPGKGQMLNVTYRVGESGAQVEQRVYDYDGFGRVAQVETSNDLTLDPEVDLIERTTYDEFGRVFQQFDVSGNDHGIRYVYNARGYLERLREAREGVNGTEYQTIESMDPRGNITSMSLANGVSVLAVYDNASGRLETLSAETALGENLQFIDYTWDVLGNLLSRNEQSGGGSFAESFNYDTLNRLLSVDLQPAGDGPTQTILSLSYDPNGNIRNKSDVGAQDYQYGTLNDGPHAVTSAGGVTYSYDANGNQISSSDGRSIQYTVFNKPTRIENINTGAFTEFSYGIGNVRITRLDGNAVDGQKTTWYFSNVERIEDESGTKFRRYLGGVAIADYYPASGNQTVDYLIKDHLGSIHTVTDDQGQVVEQMSFTAFGQRRVAGGSALLDPMELPGVNEWTTRGFTGHEHADGLGVIHMNGRIYDPKLGRFLQADPIVQAPKNSQSLNRYSYVYNNPLSYTDPSGYFSLKRFFDKWLRPLAAIAITVWMPQFAALWQAIGVSSSIAIGAITGAVAGFVGSGNSSGLVAGAFAGAAFGTLGKWKAARPFARTAKSVAHAAVGGVQHLIQGGKFGHGFFSAGFTQALGGPIGRIDPWNPGVSPQRVIAAAVVGGTASRLTGGKFANGAITGAFSRALNDELHPFVRETVTSFQKQRFWREFGGLPLNKFRAIFPSIAAGNDDFLLQTIQSGLYDEYYRSGAYGELLSVGRSANDLLADYTIGRVAGIVGARGRLATILGKGAGLTGSEIKLLKDSFAIKAFADQQGLHMSQLSDLADILIQNNQTIDQAILELQE